MTLTVNGPRVVAALARAGVHAVYVDDALGEGIEVSPALSEETRRQAARTLRSAFAQGSRALQTGNELDEAVTAELAAVAHLIAEEIAACGDAVVALQDLAAADAYTMQHSIDVTTLGLLLGRRVIDEQGWLDYKGDRRFDRREQRLAQLGLGLIMHDIGKLIVPAEVLSKPGKLTEEEWVLMRKHPLAGLDLLSPSSVSALARTVIRSHHERWDGAGYPDGKSGDTIHEFARIAAIADVYDAVTSERPYSPAWSPEAGWQLIVDGAGTAFDPNLVSVFRQVVAPYPPGCEIVLEDGRRGIVSHLEPLALEQPRVRIGWDSDGRPVRPYELELDALPALPRAA